MLKTAILTAIYDHYDSLKPVLPQKSADVDWILVTDDPPEDALGWTVVNEPKPGIHPNRAAKNPKFNPHQYTDASQTIWIDASFRINSPTFAVDALSFARPIAQFVHPWRDCLFDEARETQAIGRYAPQVPVIGQQAEHYRGLGHPEHWGLWATGVIARQTTLETVRLGELWTAHVAAWSFQDQVSQPFVLREAGLRPIALPGTHFANPWLSYEGSSRH